MPASSSSSPSSALEHRGDTKARALPMTTNTTTVITPAIIRSTLVACLGGILFGYDLGVISGALPSLTSTLDLTDSQTETVVASLFVGSILGSVLGGWCCDSLGRKRSILWCDVIFLLGSIILSTAPNYAAVIAGRIVIGVAVSVSAIADVSYLTEISPEHHRGALVSCNEACISLGFLLAYISSYLITVSINYDEGWRIMFGMSGLIAVLQFCLMLSLPESPVWLVERGRMEEARVAAQFLMTEGGGNGGRGREGYRESEVWSANVDFEDVEGESVISGATSDQLGPLPVPHTATEEDDDDDDDFQNSHCLDGADLGNKPGDNAGGEPIHLSHYWRQAIVASFLAVSQQLCGHVNILNFAPEIFAQVFWDDESLTQAQDESHANEEDEAAISPKLLATTVILGTVKFLLTTFVIFEVDRIGRRFLLLSGIAIITASLACLTAAYTLGEESIEAGTASGFTQSQRALALVGCTGVVAGYSMSYAPLTWLVTSEIFPPSIRGRSLGMSTVTTNAFAALISYTFLTGQDAFGPAMPFALYFAFSFGSLIFASVSVPDTGDVVAGSHGEDVDAVLDEMCLWRLRCCRGSGACCSRRRRRRKNGGYATDLELQRDQLVRNEERRSGCHADDDGAAAPPPPIT